MDQHQTNDRRTVHATFAENVRHRAVVSKDVPAMPNMLHFWTIFRAFQFLISLCNFAFHAVSIPQHLPFYFTPLLSFAKT